MDVASRLRQPLCIDTNIAYSLDLSKFPGLDDPQHKNQPSLLIASPVPAVSTDIIPSPTTVEIPGLNEELLDDLLSVIDWENKAYEASHEPAHKHLTNTVRQTQQVHQVQSTHHRHQGHTSVPARSHVPSHAVVNPNMRQPAQCPNKLVTNSDLSKYALDVIFTNLIYPDVSRGGSFSLDTLLQSVPREKPQQRVHSGHPETFIGEYVSRLRHITDNGNEMPSELPFRGGHSYGKRKRSSDVTCDYETQKRLKCNTEPQNSNVYSRMMSNVIPHERTMLVPRRIRELMC
ncbi:uncharacterized protein LOC124146298 [Haliotis rufescens]|uniref:uncharacterized protein LOC124146298 n=1 Tax=Haliotis rufescens TaxID=6454 RepID=UPI00201EBB7F|nr:uncharacterized protein LOC124146298 [Haliotis rufescens]